MLIQPVQEAIVSTFDIDRLAAPLTAVCGFERIDLEDAPVEQWPAWRVPTECRRIEQALLVPQRSDAGRGAIRLVRFHGVEQRVMRSSQRSWDTGGIFDVDVFSADVDRLYHALQRFGWTALGEPTDYSEAHFSVRQVVAVGPDGLMLAIIQRYVPQVSGLDASGIPSPIFNSTQIVADLDRARRFYGEVLGWTPRLDFQLVGVAEPGANVLGLPMPHAQEARRRIAMFNPPGPAIGGVELIQNLDMHGQCWDQACVAPNVGILALRFEVEDAVAYAAEIEGRGGALFAPPSRVQVEPHGSLTCFSVRSPEGAVIEFFGR
jgi:predicted enzyme related to lactoylglutathione lyase